MPIERDIDAGCYRPGPWDAVIRVNRSQPDDARIALAVDISRISRKLHLRLARRTAPLAPAITIELAATVLGGMLLAIAVKKDFNAVAIATMLIWVSTLQPLVKVAVGAMLGVGYEYGYLYGIEPRFKMKFGSYVAAPRWKRIMLHASGMFGSPLGAILVAWIAGDSLQIARAACWVVFWITLAINLISSHRLEIDSGDLRKLKTDMAATNELEARSRKVETALNRAVIARDKFATF